MVLRQQTARHAGPAHTPLRQARHGRHGENGPRGLRQLAPSVRIGTAVDDPLGFTTAGPPTQCAAFDRECCNPCCAGRALSHMPRSAPKGCDIGFQGCTHMLRAFELEGALV